MNKKDYLQALIFIVICEAAGIVGSLFTTPKIGTWYAGLEKPLLSPPNWIFGPVWTTLYALMGVAAYLVWRKRKEDKRVEEALIFFGIQLFLNSLWSIIFFGTESLDGAFGCLVILWIAIVLTIIKFWPISKKAAYLMLPYIVWVTFAGYLNYMLAQLN